METPSSNAVLIELAHVDVVSSRDSAQTVVVDVNWSIKEGDFWIIDGPNTSGKSNLISTAACLQRPGNGIISLFGNTTTSLPPAELLRRRLRLGVVFKGGGRMFSHLSVIENIALPLCYQFNWPQSRATDLAEELMRLTDLTAHAYEMPETLSSSWQQRVGLARALALKPEVLFLDDPLAGLELNHRHWWQDFLDQLAKGIAYTEKRPLTLALATNDFDRWLTQGRQFAFIKEAKWQVLGGAEEAKNLPPSEHN